MLIIETDFQLTGLSWRESIVRIILTTESHSIIKLTSEMMMRTDPSKQCNNGDIKSWLGMGNCHWLCLSAFIWWKVCVSVWWVRAYYHRDMAVQAIAGPLSCVFCKTLVRYVLLSLRRSWPVPEPARDRVMVYLKASSLRLWRCPHLTDWRRCQGPTAHYPGRGHQDCHCNYTLSIREWADKSHPITPW